MGSDLKRRLVPEAVLSSSRIVVLDCPLPSFFSASSTGKLGDLAGGPMMAACLEKDRCTASCKKDVHILISAWLHMVAEVTIYPVYAFGLLLSACLTSAGPPCWVLVLQARCTIGDGIGKAKGVKHSSLEYGHHFLGWMLINFPCSDRFRTLRLGFQGWM